MSWDPEDRFTVGIEEEFQLVDPETGALVSRAEKVLEGASGSRLQRELFLSVVETATPVCSDIAEARTQVRDLRGDLIDRGGEQGLLVAASGTHPFAQYEDQELTSTDRYHALARDVRWPFVRSLVFGQHVHVGMGSPREVVAAMNALRAFVPLLLALSVNAPFWRGLDTGLASVRLRVFEAMPRSGLQRRFRDWEDLRLTVDTLRKAGALEDLSTVWWDVRPRPSLGTVEVRVCDAQPEAERSLALAGLVQAVAARAVRAQEEGERLPLLHLDEVVAENRWRAMRDGTRARLIRVDAGDQVDLVAVPEALELALLELEEEIEDLGLEEEARTLAKLASRHDMGAERQRSVFSKEDDLAAVVRDVARRTRP